MARSPLTPEEAAEQETLGARIRKFRERRGLQKQELAAALGVDPSAITHIETGRRPVSTSRLDTIAKILGISVPALLDDDSPLGELAVAARGPGNRRRADSGAADRDHDQPRRRRRIPRRPGSRSAACQAKSCCRRASAPLACSE